MTWPQADAPWWVFAAVHVAHIGLLVLFPPLLQGIIHKVKAWMSGREGPGLLQLYFDLVKLVRKGTVFSTASTWVFRLGPVAGVVTALTAGLLVPWGRASAPIGFTGDLLMFAYLLALGRFCTILSALDTGSAFEGMGASREATYSCLVEPALFLGLMALAQMLAVGEPLNLGHLLGTARGAWHSHPGTMILITISWLLVLLVENCRVPFDDPNTHLELTMIHEVMVLDHSGPPLALILYGAALKFVVTGCLGVALGLPYTGHAAIDLCVAILGLVGLAVAVGVLESVIARQRLINVPMLLVAASLMAGFSVALIALR